MNKKWWILIIVGVVLLLLAIPSGMLLNIHNSVYDCSFAYEKVDDPITEIAKKYTYYDANNKTVEIELSQDMINSQIKDYLETMVLDLPANISVEEVMFNAKDQRVYINAKYGKLNIPLSAKININFSDMGLEIAADDLNLGNSNAPGFLKKQLPNDMLTYTFKYEDLQIPQVFSVKDIKYGTGIVKAIIQLDSNKIVDMTMNYREELVDTLNDIKSEQSEVVSTFITKLLGTDILSETNTKEYVDQLLNNEELVNSAIQFAFADDLTKYSTKVQEVQQKVMEWAAPLEVVQYYGNIDDTVNTILYDEDLQELLTWFLPSETIEEYIDTTESYYAMATDYYAQFVSAKASFDQTIASIDTNAIHAYADQARLLSKQVEDGKITLVELVDQIDTEIVAEFISTLESDQGMIGEYVHSLDPTYAQLVKVSSGDLDEAKVVTKDYVQDVDLAIIHEFVDVVEEWEKISVDIITLLKNQQYEQAYYKLANSNINYGKTLAFTTKYFQDGKLSIIDEYNTTINDMFAQMEGQEF